MSYLRDCVDALVCHYLAANDPAGAAPWLELHYDVLRLESNDLATQKVEQAVDHMIVASRKRSASAATREWRDHFIVSRCRRTLVSLQPDKRELARNVPILETLAKTTDSSLVRLEVRIELAGHHVELDSEDVERRLADLAHLDTPFKDEGRDWVIAASLLRPKINRAMNMTKPAAAASEIEEYARLVIPRQNFRQTKLAIEWKAALDQPLDVPLPEPRYRPWIPPIEPFTERDLERWGVNDLEKLSTKNRPASSFSTRNRRDRQCA